MVEVITVKPEPNGWTISHEPEHRRQCFHNGVTAEAIARQLGDAIASGGRMAEIRIFLRDGRLAGRIVCPSRR
jgi:hypothetical protein